MNANRLAMLREIDLLVKRAGYAHVPGVTNSKCPACRKIGQVSSLLLEKEQKTEQRESFLDRCGARPDMMILMWLLSVLLGATLGVALEWYILEPVVRFFSK